MLSASLIGVVLLIIFVATLVRGTFGFGEALVGMPLLAFVIQMRVATTLITLLCLCISFVMLLDEWRHISVRCALALIFSSLVGIPFGVYLLVHVQEAWIKLALAVLVLAFAGYSLLRPKLPKIDNWWLPFPMGFLAGMLGGAYNTQGPPIVIYSALRQWDPSKFRATIQAFALPTGIAIVIFHASAGLIDFNVLRLFLITLPVFFFAFLVGCKLRMELTTNEFTRYVYFLLLGCGATLLVSSVRSLAVSWN